jgi:hypothetical protein
MIEVRTDNGRLIGSMSEVTMVIDGLGFNMLRGKEGPQGIGRGILSRGRDLSRFRHETLAGRMALMFIGGRGEQSLGSVDPIRFGNVMRLLLLLGYDRERYQLGGRKARQTLRLNGLSLSILLIFLCKPLILFLGKVSRFVGCWKRSLFLTN